MQHTIVRMFHEDIRVIVDEFSADRLEGGHRGSLVVILRGLRGSGKSTFATLLKLYAESIGLEAQICSADDYFTTARGYNFVPNQLPHAHERCRDYCRQALLRRVPVVIIDNTNVIQSEWMSYVRQAQDGNHFVRRVNFVGDLTVEELRGRTSRDISLPAMIRRQQLFRQDQEIFAPHNQVTMRRDVFTPQPDEVPVRMHPMELMFFEQIDVQLKAFLRFRERANEMDARQSLVIVLRGMPGCGKTTFALQIQVYAQAMGLRTVICSSDDHFRSRYGFQYDQALDGDARRACIDKLRHALHRHVDVVVVDDANITQDDCRLMLFEASLHQVVLVNFVCVSMEMAEAQLARSFTRVAYFDRESLGNLFAAFHVTQLPTHIDISPVFNAWDAETEQANRAT